MQKLTFLKLLATMNGVLLRRGALAWMSPIVRTTTRAAPLSRRPFHPTSPKLLTTRRNAWEDDEEEEGWGGERIIRPSKRQQQPSTRSSYSDDRSSSWDRDDSQRDRRPPRKFQNDRQQQRGGGDWRRRKGDFDSSNNNGRGNNNNNNNRWDRNNNNSQKRRAKSEETKIDMKGLEAEGFVHLYGLAPILSALKSNQRDFSPRESLDDLVSARFQERDDNYVIDEDDDFAFENPNPQEKKADTKPEAQFTPWLFLQDRSAGGGSSGRTGDKMAAASEVQQLAEELGIPVAYSDKGSLNALSGNRPHQGFVLRCGPLEFERLSRIPHPSTTSEPLPKLWLVLDEVVDPQNLGALLRSCFFLGGNNSSRMGILVCSKNSAPPSPVVSAASAGALELLNVYSTNSLPRTLAAAKEDGFRIIGAASSKPRGLEEDDSIPLYDLQNLPLNHNSDEDDNRPTLLVLGSEGHGLRTLVAKLCTEFVRIPRGDSLSGMDVDHDEEETGGDGSVDSLNVSVTGGILLWHLLYGAGGAEA
ncbi:tRNA/rRNA methyltransferase [Seminavis robusta]|uniref:rRNA methyltransferase 1, mitochondrial n=1 Tax=Seminavis robusta TaxID=568900 RepID=A0A9N8HX30_9STRA|nr:tRNA/rRNA methyltransferase [Seminavis robusta]|eukprot:Sro2113_g315030.1 tRNA/rRNA methyltransferase (530) ;mRNA; r:2191-3892